MVSITRRRYASRIIFRTRERRSQNNCGKRVVDQVGNRKSKRGSGDGKTSRAVMYGTASERASRHLNLF